MIQESWPIPRYAVIPSNGRPCLHDAIEAIESQVDKVILVTTPENREPWSDYADAIVLHGGDVNISHWWNLGLDWADTDSSEFYQSAKYDVALINDDVIVPEGWFDAISGTMRGMQVAAGCSGGIGPVPVLQTRAGPVPLYERMHGFAYIIRGELGLRANEQFRWYYSDDFMDWESRKLGGMIMIPGNHVKHLYPNQQVTGEMQVMIAEDAQRFKDHYGMMPW